jgi:hypothetical protein
MNCTGGEVRGNTFVNNHAFDMGGGLLCENCSPGISENHFEYNGGNYGAALCCLNGASPEITLNTFVSNRSQRSGGGIACFSECGPEITWNVFRADSAWHSFSGDGGAIMMYDDCTGTIAHNEFEDCYSWSGGGITIAYGSATLVTTNTFTSCEAYDRGGGIYCVNNATPLITDNIFTDCRSEYGAALAVVSHADPTVEANTFDTNISTKWGGAICLRDTASAHIKGNRIYHNVASGTGGGIQVQKDSEADIIENVMWDNSADYGGAVSISLDSFGRCVNNTFYANTAAHKGSSIQSYTGSMVRVLRCIVAASSGPAAVHCWGLGSAVVDCNDFWANDSDYYGCAPGPSDFYLDPLLCDPDYGNFYIDCISPCNGHPGCGTVGALPVGCGATGAEPTTWGRIKTRWR